jgi:hypothetical protein
MKDFAIGVQDSGKPDGISRHQRGDGSGWVTPDACGTSLRRMDSGLCKRIIHRRADDTPSPDKLQASDELAVRWRETLHKRVETKNVGASTARRKSLTEPQRRTALHLDNQMQGGSTLCVLLSGPYSLAVVDSTVLVLSRLLFSVLNHLTARA